MTRDGAEGRERRLRKGWREAGGGEGRGGGWEGGGLRRGGKETLFVYPTYESEEVTIKLTLRGL